jgi:FMN phosphatase YigB (HAD superfamily)
MTFEEAIEQCGWNETSQVSILLQYIESQCSDAAFEDYLEQAVAEELAIGSKWEHLRDEWAERMIKEVCPDDLDGIVHEMSQLNAAAVINNSGVEYQLRFLRQCGLSDRQILNLAGFEEEKDGID